MTTGTMIDDSLITDTAIRTRGLVKTYGKVRALDSLDLTVRTGEVHGFLGPNGAGKSTTMKVLLGLVRADAGTVELLGGDPWRDAVSLHRRIAYVPGDVDLWPTLTGGEAIDLLGRMRGGLNEARRAELVDRFDLDPSKKGRTYSKGNRQKVALIAALACDAELLVLDEPTSGLDPLMEAVFQAAVADAKARGCTVLLSSHILAEVERLSDRISIIRAGRIVQTGTLSELRHLTLTRIDARTARPVQGIATIEGVTDVEVDPSAGTADRIRFSVDGDRLDAAIRHLGRFEILALTSQPPTLEEIMLRHYRRTGDE